MPAVSRNRGEIIKYTGDGFIATFASALDAVRAAVEVQSGAKAASATTEEERRILFRIGVNAGDVIVVPGDVYGDSVNIAARLQGLAKPGGICVSRSVRDTVKGKFEIDFTDLGDLDVKNIPDPVGAYDLKYQAIAWTMERKGVQDAAAPPAHRGRRLALAVGAAAAAIIAGVAGWMWMGSTIVPPPPTVATGPSSPPVVPAGPPAAPAPSPAPIPPLQPPPAGSSAPGFEQLLSERIARMAPNVSEVNRAEVVSAYLQQQRSRALAVSPSNGRMARAGPYETVERAEERALEACQLRSGTLCAIAASNDALAPVNAPPWPVRDMPRLSYSGLFDPAQLPTVNALRSRQDVVGYRALTGAKAAAIHPTAGLHIASGTPSQNEAEKMALEACNADLARERRDVPCLLYAVGDQVVLPRRSTAPLTPIALGLPATTASPVIVPAVPPPPTPVVTAPSPALKEQILALVTARTPNLTEAQRAARVDQYLDERAGRALAIAPIRSGTWRTGGHVTAAEAEDRALEGCMIFYGEPCVLVAVNEAAVQPVMKPAPRVIYSGLFDPAQVPAFASVRTRQDIMAYRGAVGPKAVALHPWGIAHVVTGAANQREAEEQALVGCTASPIHRNRDLPCYLYATAIRSCCRAAPRARSRPDRVAACLALLLSPRGRPRSGFP